MKYYKAHWGGRLVSLTVVQTALCLGVAVYGSRHGHGGLCLAALALTIGCALFSILGYTITPDAILVHRPFWATRLPLAGLQSAQTGPRGRSWRSIFIGNKGFFFFGGWSYVPGGGLYRIYVTDPNQKVLLHYSNRKVMVSPCAPEQFVHDLPIQAGNRL